MSSAEENNSDEENKMSSAEENNSEIEEGDMEFEEEEEQPKQKKRKAGIIFLPTIPPYMTVLKLREILGEFGEIGRVFLQPDEKAATRKKKGPALQFSEGWIEYKSKRVAKYVAQTLNNNRIGTRKKSKHYDYIWNIKYLPRFKWVHLSERLAYERAVHKQRLQAEIVQAKKEASHFQASVERSEKVRRLQKKQKLDKVIASQQSFMPSQRQTDAEHRSKHPQDKNTQRKQLVQTLFGKKKSSN